MIFEELGHWLESGLETDSEGDEGERFAQLIAGKDNQKQTGREYARLLINGKIIEAELSDTQSNIKQGSPNSEVPTTPDQSNQKEKAIATSGDEIRSAQPADAKPKTQSNTTTQPESSEGGVSQVDAETVKATTDELIDKSTHFPIKTTATIGNL